MKTLETRIAGVEARMFPEREKPCILYVVHETDSAFEQDIIKEKAIAEYERRHGAEVDPDNASFICLVIVYDNR
jgi:hypothetical protein